MPDPTPVTVNLASLRRALELVLDEVEQSHGPEVSVMGDYYWTLALRPHFALRRPTKRHLGVAQLSDDVEAVEQLIRQSADEPIVASHELEHLSGILLSLAEVDRGNA